MRNMTYLPPPRSSISFMFERESRDLSEAERTAQLAAEFRSAGDKARVSNQQICCTARSDGSNRKEFRSSFSSDPTRFASLRRMIHVSPPSTSFAAMFQKQSSATIGLDSSKPLQQGFKQATAKACTRQSQVRKMLGYARKPSPLSQSSIAMQRPAEPTALPPLTIQLPPPASPLPRNFSLKGLHSLADHKAQVMIGPLDHSLNPLVTMTVAGALHILLRGLERNVQGPSLTHISSKSLRGRGRGFLNSLSIQTPGAAATADTSNIIIELYYLLSTVMRHHAVSAFALLEAFMLLDCAVHGGLALTQSNVREFTIAALGLAHQRLSKQQADHRGVGTGHVTTFWTSLSYASISLKRVAAAELELAQKLRFDLHVLDDAELRCKHAKGLSLVAKHYRQASNTLHPISVSYK
uniref:Uncharacterized protein n=1 Tax=Chrysotila carterae TaxID=13221 RepID=A0A7S4F6X3_CHRCT